MKMKKILNEWKKFILKESVEKSNLELAIEAAWQGKYNQELADVKAAIHALRFLNGGSVNNLESYLNRVEFGKTAKERIQAINRGASKFGEMYDAVEVYRPPLDRRFADTSEKTFKGIGVVSVFAQNNMKSSDHDGLLTKGAEPEVAYKELFKKFDLLDQMLDSGNYNFLETFGRISGGVNMDARHSGGAYSTGLIIVPDETTEEENDKMMQHYNFYLKHYSDPAYIMAIQAEKALQKAIKMALSYWTKYGGFKDGADIQANKGAWLRMKKALKNSEQIVARIESDPSSYQGISTKKPVEMSDEERAEELLNKARSGDKQAAGEAFKLFRKMRNNAKAREARMLMR